MEGEEDSELEQFETVLLEDADAAAIVEDGKAIIEGPVVNDNEVFNLVRRMREDVEKSRKRTEEGMKAYIESMDEKEIDQFKEELNKDREQLRKTELELQLAKKQFDEKDAIFKQDEEKYKTGTDKKWKELNAGRLLKWQDFRLKFPRIYDMKMRDISLGTGELNFKQTEADRRKSYLTRENGLKERKKVLATMAQGMVAPKPNSVTSQSGNTIPQSGRKVPPPIPKLKEVPESDKTPEFRKLEETEKKLLKDISRCMEDTKKKKMDLEVLEERGRYLEILKRTSNLGIKEKKEEEKVIKEKRVKEREISTAKSTIAMRRSSLIKTHEQMNNMAEQIAREKSALGSVEVGSSADKAETKSIKKNLNNSGPGSVSAATSAFAGRVEPSSSSSIGRPPSMPPSRADIKARDINV